MLAPVSRRPHLCRAIYPQTSVSLFLARSRRAKRRNAQEIDPCAMAFAPRNSKPPERPRDLRPIKGGGKSASAPLRGAFFPLPGAGASPTRALAPRKQLPSGGRTLSSRVYVLVSQVSHVTPQVQHTAIQELALLASTSDASRLEILAAGGDKQLIKMASRCEEAQLLRWALAVLVSLAADDWSRQRQQKMLPRLVALLAGTDEVVAKEA